MMQLKQALESQANNAMSAAQLSTMKPEIFELSRRLPSLESRGGGNSGKTTMPREGSGDEEVQQRLLEMVTGLPFHTSLLPTMVRDEGLKSIASEIR